MKQGEVIISESLLKRVVFFKAVGAVAKIGSSLKPNHHKQVKLVELSYKYKLLRTF